MNKNLQNLDSRQIMPHMGFSIFLSFVLLIASFLGAYKTKNPYFTIFLKISYFSMGLFFWIFAGNIYNFFIKTRKKFFPLYLTLIGILLVFILPMILKPLPPLKPNPLVDVTTKRFDWHLVFNQYFPLPVFIHGVYLSLELLIEEYSNGEDFVFPVVWVLCIVIGLRGISNILPQLEFFFLIIIYLAILISMFFINKFTKKSVITNKKVKPKKPSSIEKRK
jgi:hypothetical protein